MSLHAAPVPWILLAVLLPLLAGLGGHLHSARRSVWSAVGLGTLWLVHARLLLGFDAGLEGYQFATALPGLTVGLDGWGLIGLTVSLGIVTVCALLTWTRSTNLPALLVASSAAVLAHTSLDLSVVLLSAYAGILLLGDRSSWTVLLLGLAVLGLAGMRDPLLSYPLLFIGLGGLAARAPSAEAWRMLLRAGALTPALLLSLPRLVFPELGDGFLVWAQATALCAALLALWGALRALGARDLGGMASGLVTLQAGLALTAWHSIRLDSWNGAVLVALWIGPLAGLLLTLHASPASARWSRLRGQPRRAALATLGGLAVGGLPATPLFPALLLISIGAWDSQWRYAPWWLALLAIATWIGAFAPVRAAQAMRRGPPGEPPPPLPRLAVFLAVCTVFVGVVPRLLLDPIDSTSVNHIRALTPSVERLIDGELRPLLPPFLQGWWL